MPRRAPGCERGPRLGRPAPAPCAQVVSLVAGSQEPGALPSWAASAWRDPHNADQGVTVAAGRPVRGRGLTALLGGACLPLALADPRGALQREGQRPGRPQSNGPWPGAPVCGEQSLGGRALGGQRTARVIRAVAGAHSSFKSAWVMCCAGAWRTAAASIYIGLRGAPASRPHATSPAPAREPRPPPAFCTSAAHARWAAALEPRPPARVPGLGPRPAGLGPRRLACLGPRDAAHPVGEQRRRLPGLGPPKLEQRRGRKLLRDVARPGAAARDRQLAHRRAGGQVKVVQLHPKGIRRGG